MDINFIFEFKIDFNIVKERIIRRSKEEDRSDDNLDVIKTRLEKYMLETYPVSQSFCEKFNKNYYKIDVAHEVSKIQIELMKIIKKGVKYVKFTISELDLSVIFNVCTLIHFIYRLK